MAAQFESLKKGLKTILEGRVLEHEGKTIYNKRFSAGESEGRMKEKQDTAEQLYRIGEEIKTIAAAGCASMNQVTRWVSAPVDSPSAV